MQRPGGVIPALDRLKQVAAVVIRIAAGHLVSLFLGHAFDTLIGFKVILHPKPLAFCVYPHIGMAGVAVHVPPGGGNAAVAHEPSHLVSRFRHQRPKIPLHVVVAQAIIGATLLGMDKVLELHWVAYKEHGGVVTHHVEVTFFGVELDREAARIAPCIRATALPCYSGKANEDIGLRAWLQKFCFGVLANVLSDFKVTKSATAFRMGLPVGNHFPVKRRHLLHQVVIVHHDRTIRAYRQRMLIARYRNTCFVGGGMLATTAHCSSSLSHSTWYGLYHWKSPLLLFNVS